jgi:hypothetical protein
MSTCALSVAEAGQGIGQGVAGVGLQERVACLASEVDRFAHAVARLGSPAVANQELPGRHFETGGPFGVADGREEPLRPSEVGVGGAGVRFGLGRDGKRRQRVDLAGDVGETFVEIERGAQRRRGGLFVPGRESRTPAWSASAATASNSIAGTVYGNAVQANDVSGGITFG